MKIENENTSAKKFKNLKEGEVFSYNCDFFIKTDSIYEDTYDDFGETKDSIEYNSIKLETGMHNTFDDEDLVIPIPNAVLKISN